MSIKLPITFIVTGIFAFVFFQTENLFSFAGWMTDHPRNALGWTQVHLLVLGWATMIAMGAVYQLIHVVLQRNVYSQLLGYIHYALFAIGTFGLLLGFFNFNTGWIALFASLAALGIFVFVFNTAYTIILSKQWNPITLSTLFALFYLALAALAGTLMGINFALNLWNGLHDRLFAAHIWMGALGWFGLLITGFSYKLLPMFYLAHNFPTRLQHTTLWLWNVGVLLGTINFLIQIANVLNIIALLLIVCAMVTYNLHINQIVRSRHKSSPGTGIVIAVWIARGLLATSVIALLWLSFAPKMFWDISTLQIFVWLYLWGWVALTIMSYMSKIIPFLWWTYKYGSQIGKKKVPVMSDLLSETYTRWTLISVICTFALVVVGFIIQYHPLVQWGGSLLSIASFVYMFLIIKVFFR